MASMLGVDELFLRQMQGHSQLRVKSLSHAF